MHEYGLVEALLGRVETEAHARKATAVHRLTVRIGPLCGGRSRPLRKRLPAVPAWHALSRSGVVLRTEEVDWRCDVCNAAIPPRAIVPGADRPSRCRRPRAPVGHRRSLPRSRPRDRDAVRRLGGACHRRAPVVLRRARRYALRAVHVRPLARPVLAAGRSSRTPSAWGSGTPRISGRTSVTSTTSRRCGRSSSRSPDGALARRAPPDRRTGPPSGLSVYGLRTGPARRGQDRRAASPRARCQRHRRTWYGPTGARRRL